MTKTIQQFFDSAGKTAIITDGLRELENEIAEVFAEAGEWF